MKSIHPGQTGNAMIYVLIAVALFTALSFTVSRTTKTSGNLSMEKATLAAQQIISYAEKINGAVQNLMLQNSCLGTQISFENATMAGYTNAAAPANKKCHIFDLAGGGMNFEMPDGDALDTVAAAASAFPAGALVGNYFFTGKVCVDNVGSGPVATCATDGLSNEELLLILPWVSQSVCTAINTILKNSAAILQDNDGSFDNTKFTGTYADGFAIGRAGFTTYPNGCYQSTAAGSSPGVGYHFYYTLLAR
jgi:hypothetical protein